MEMRRQKQDAEKPLVEDIRLLGRILGDVIRIHEGEAVDPQSLARAIVKTVSAEHNFSEMHVAGNSLGGWIALEMGAVAPENVKSVTALAPAGLWHQGPTSQLPPSFFDARILAKISQHFMKLAYHLPPLKAIGYKKITHLWRELSFESCRDSVQIGRAHV